MPGKCFLEKILFGAKERILTVEFESTWSYKDGKLTLNKTEHAVQSYAAGKTNMIAMLKKQC